jgi:hypothetical protein
VNVVCSQVEVSVPGRSLVQRNPTKCGVSESDLESSTAPSGARPHYRPARGYRAMRKIHAINSDEFLAPNFDVFPKLHVQMHKRLDNHVLL